MLTVNEFISIAKDIADNHKTLYVSGCFGSPLNETNKKRFTTNNYYNASPVRSEMIKKATNDTFGFDCVCLIKGILWGWNGNLNHVYGGAKYASNNIPDCSELSLLQMCKDVSKNFDNIVAGEMVYMKGHVGIYIGNGLVIECSPKWKNCVQYSFLGNKPEYQKGNYRIWLSHGKLPNVDYNNVLTDNILSAYIKTIDELALEVLQGKWGNGSNRKKKLTEAGFDYTLVQKRVNDLLK